MVYLLRFKNIIIALIVSVCLFILGTKISAYFAAKERTLIVKVNEVEEKMAWSGKISTMERQLQQHQEHFLDGDLFLFKKMLVQHAKETNVQIQSFKPDVSRVVEETLGYKETVVLLAIKGSYNDLVYFIEKLEDEGSVKFKNLVRGDSDDRFNVVFSVLLRK